MSLLSFQVTKESLGARHRDRICLSCKLCQSHLPVTTETGRGYHGVAGGKLEKKGDTET